jgi:hypothetical protein
VKDFVVGLNQLRILKDIAGSFKEDFLAYKQETNRTRFRLYHVRYAEISLLCWSGSR